MQRTDVVIGIDGGGTHTRVIAADIEGNVLAYCKREALPRTGTLPLSIT